MTSYHLWTVGCQMNVADSERLGLSLDQLGYESVGRAEDADIVVLNSCVVRQGAEDKVVGRLDSLKSYKKNNPDATIALMGCMVGPRTDALRERFPHVDFFMRPQDFTALVEFAAERQGLSCDTDQSLLVPSQPTVSTFVPVIQGCDEFCTYCIVPYRRGRETSRPVEELVREAEMLAARGAREITLLGQIVDRYGHDLPDKPDLADLLRAIHPVERLERIRFLTSHPRDMTQRILDAVAELPKACEHLNLPFQAGADEVLERMRRPYKIADYLELIERARGTIPGVAISTDVIVGFCGETDEEFQQTMDVLEQVRFDVVHVAPYSTRPGTIADRKLVDDVSPAVKIQRRKAVEELQERIVTEINAPLAGTRQEILIERRVKESWTGRTRTNKIVHVQGTDASLEGHVIEVDIVRAGPWSLAGVLPGTDAADAINSPSREIELMPA